MSYRLLREILSDAQNENLKFWQVILNDNCRENRITEKESFSKMTDMYIAMKEADSNYDSKAKSASGMAGGDGKLLEDFRKQPNRLIGDFLTKVIEKAVKMGESNACMKRIVAAPTAGSCGVIPAVLITYEEEKKVAQDRIIEALYVAGGIGEVIAQSAEISGAKGGCQAEIGSASAMAAGAVVYLEGGDNEAIIHSAALALKNMLGLTCDPVGGLVEVPCIKRNVSGAVNAIVSSQMAIAGIRSRIEPDEVIDSMKRIGNLLPECLRETSKDGLAITSSAIKIMENISS
ncbi:MAG: L-serine ammonia-lyase, iron-sulfur-dependent, subunit alpha [Lachnospiraceae bacterium]|nr:L-serine ammonia-lyase, iron-sulfur-dependent, subunit alpha [Lachnospiraceae bacterium]